MKFLQDIVSIMLSVLSVGAVPENAQLTEQERLIQPYVQACRDTDVPPKVALAIARHESGLNPYALNVAGKSFMPGSREEALEIIRQAEAAGKSFDVGLMQINNQWFSKLGLTAESLLDPTLNIATGVKILNMEFEKHGRNWHAVGYYHSPDNARGLNYSWRVYQLYHGLTDELPKGKIYAQQKGGYQNIPDGTGIWRNPGAGQTSRIKSFQVRGEGIIRLSGSRSGEPAGPAGTAQN